MTSTEQKNVSHPFIDSCNQFGVLATLAANAVCHPELDTGRPPFNGLGHTSAIGTRCRASLDPIEEATRLFPTLSTAPYSTRDSSLLLKLTSDASTYFGNFAVIRIAEAIVSRRWDLHFTDVGAVKQATRHATKICAHLAPGSYGDIGRTTNNTARLQHRKQSHYLRIASDVFDYLNRCPADFRHEHKVRRWCSKGASSISLSAYYRSRKRALQDYCNFNPEDIIGLPEVPFQKQRYIASPRTSPQQFQLLKYRGKVYIKLKSKYGSGGPTRLCTPNKAKTHLVAPKQRKMNNELYILSSRDLQDLSFLLMAMSHVRMYYDRRILDVTDRTLRYRVSLAQTEMWSLYLAVLRTCGMAHELRNKLGVYFDVLQWRYLAHKSGDIFFNHSKIMGNKIESKGLTHLPNQDNMLSTLKSLPMDVAVDLLGIYKASIYPEVDPYKVVSDQYALHMSRFDTRWQPGSNEQIRFDETRSYMWYLGVRVLYTRFNVWPGKIRDGVEPKDWHKRYKHDGIPGSEWRHACDVDLRGVLTVADITNEQYVKQQDSACAPPLWTEYSSFLAMKKAPRRHRRKLLYAIQEETLEDLPQIVRRLNEIGENLPTGYTGKIAFETNFSTDIVTGSRCERHKDAPRPFYAASPPWGCILSYFDGITRDFLSHVPQSMLGKSTRQKFLDLSTTAAASIESFDTFYMSDDKAKYSPRMDPNSQQLPAEFFAELFDIPGMKAFGPVMYHCNLYYRVHGHLVSYNSNGTDREGMRGASNTWLEIVAQGLSTRLCREQGLIRGKSTFLSFIDDGLRKFTVESKNRTASESHDAAMEVVNDVIFGLKVLGRELSWDKTFISRDLFVILNELVYDGAFISSGLKSFTTVGDIELKEVMSAADYEQLYFGKLRGAHGVGAPLDLCHYVYVYETLISHYKMGINLQDNIKLSNFDYRLFCITPIALGGGGFRSALQLACNEVASATKEGMGNMMRFAHAFELVAPCIFMILKQPLARLSPIDFMREPEQFHVEGPRIKTQRLAAEVRKVLPAIVGNDMSKDMLQQDELGMKLLHGLGTTLLATQNASAEEVRLLYATTPVAFVDEFIQKLASSTTISELLGRDKIRSMRRMVRTDLKTTAEYFYQRSHSRELFMNLGDALSQVATLRDFLVK